MSIIRTTALIAGGSAVAGAGLSVGRDAYKGVKKNLGLIVVLVVVGSALYGSYKVGVWLGRNHQSLTGGVLVRSGALIVLGVCWLGSLLVGMLILGGALMPVPIADMTLAQALAHFTTFDTPAGAISLGLLCVTAVGVLRGLAIRKGRRRAWEADAHNAWFLEGHGLQEIQEDRLRDSYDNGYRLENVLPGELEFMALGHKGMRAYLAFDETGKFTSWSGVVPQR